MKGLVRKDLYMVWKYCRALLFIMLVFAVCSVGTDSQFAMFYPAVLAGILPVNIVSYDEHSRWNIYSDVLPVSRAQQVASKYIISLMGIIGVDTIITIAQVIKMMQNKTFDSTSFISLIAVLLFTSVIGPGVLLPLIFKFGSEKGRIGYYLVIGFVCACAAIFMMNDIAVELPRFTTGIVFVVAAALYGLSWLLSTKLYEGREL